MTTHRKTDNGHAELDSVFEYELNNWKIGDKNYEVDNAGRVTKRLNKTYTYGAQGRIISVSENGVVLAEYIYDEAGLPFIKKKDNKITEYYLNPGKVNSALLTDEALFQPVEVMGRVVGVLENENFIPIKADFRNSFLEDENGIRNISSPYGDRLNKYRVEHGTGPGKFSTIIDFASKGYDIDLDLLLATLCKNCDSHAGVAFIIRMGHRYQDNVSKRFITPDPLFMESPEKCVESPGQCNLYSYAGNNPINYLDPNGLDWKTRVWGGVRFITGVGEMVVGAAGIVTPEPGTTILGAIVYASGADDASAGFMEMWTGKSRNSLRYTAVKHMTDSEVTAAWTELITSAAGVTLTKRLLAKGAQLFSSYSKAIVKTSPGVNIKKTGNYWVKSIDENSNKLSQWLGRRSLNEQSKALDKLGNMAPKHILKNNKLVIKNVGIYNKSINFWKVWWKGTKRLRTPINDIRPRNIGANGQIFDPAIDPIFRKLIGGGAIGTGILSIINFYQKIKQKK